MLVPRTLAFSRLAAKWMPERRCVNVCVIMLSTIGENGFAVNCCRLENKLCF